MTEPDREGRRRAAAAKFAETSEMRRADDSRSMAKLASNGSPSSPSPCRRGEAYGEPGSETRRCKGAKPIDPTAADDLVTVELVT